MLDMGFIHDVRKIIHLLPRKRQNLLFSATFSDEIRALSGQILHAPVEIEVARRNAAAELVSHVVYPVEKDKKRELLSYLVGSERWKQVLVFVRTKHGADRLARQLEADGINTGVLHGNKSQGARTQALAGFKNGMVTVLVATDIAARGLDIDQLPHVVNYELPNVPEDYVHRIGRTGRAGSTGQAVSLVCQEEIKLLAAIERVLMKDIPRAVASGFEPAFSLDTRNPNLPRSALPGRTQRNGDGLSRHNTQAPPNRRGGATKAKHDNPGRRR
jgi:ATP-dependent RNA helicase RhlE